MVRRSSLIFAASLAVLSTLEPTLGFAAAAPAHQHDELERPRFLRREIKRAFLNVSTSIGPGDYHGPFGGQSTSESSRLESLTDSLTINPPETTEASTTAPVITQTPPDLQSIQSEVSQSLLALESSQSQSQASSPSTAAPPPTSTPATSQEVSPTTPALPVTSPSISSNTNGVPTKSTETSAPDISSTASSSNAEGATTFATTALGNSDTSGSTGQSLSTSSQSPETQTPTTQPVLPVSVTTSASGEQNTAGTSQSTEGSATVSSSNSLSSSENAGISESLPGSQLPATSASSASEAEGGQQTMSSAMSDSQVTEPSGSATSPSPASETKSEQQPIFSVTSIPPATDFIGSQQTSLPITPDTQATSESKPTTGITARTASSPSSELPTTIAGQASETHSTSVQTPPSVTVPISVQTPPSVTVPISTPSTKVSAPELSQSNIVSGIEHSSSVSATGQEQSSPSATKQTSAAGQQISPSTTTPGETSQSGSQEQPGNTGKSSIPAVVNTVNTNQQPFTQPSQSQTSVAAILSHSATLPEVSSNVANANTLHSSSAAGIQLPPGATSQNLPPSATDHATPGSQTFSNTMATAESGTQAPANSKTTQNGFFPTLSTSAVASLGVSIGESQTSEAQPASSPAPPESASVHPTVSSTQPVNSFGSGEVTLPSTPTTQGASNTGRLLPTPKSSVSNPLDTGNFEGSTLTGTELYSALTNALQTSVGPGSTMLPNGAIVPTAVSREGGNTVSTQPGKGSGGQGQSSGNPGASSATQLSGEMVSSPSEASSAASGAPAFTSNGVVISTPLASNVPFTSNGIVISSPLASNAPVTSSGIVLTNSLGSISTPVPVIASLTLSDGRVVPTTLTSVSPSFTDGQSGIEPQSSAGFGPSNYPESGSTGNSGTAISAVSNSAPQTSMMTSNGVVIPVPVPSSAVVNTGVTDTAFGQSGLPISTGAPQSISLQSGQSVNSGAIETAPVSLPSGTVLSGSVASPASGTLATGLTSPIVVGSATNSNGDSVPITAGQVTGSTLSGGTFVPLTASNPTAASASGVPTSPVVVGSATNSNGDTVPITAGQVTGSTLSGGTFVPLTASNPTAASASGVPASSNSGSNSQMLSNGVSTSVASESGSQTVASAGQETETAGQTGAGQSGVSQTTGSQSAEGQSSGASGVTATGVAQSETLPAPAPITGTATAQPNAVATSPASLPIATESQNFPSNGKGPFTQQPTSYDTNTIQSVPTSILAQPTSALSSQSSFSGPTGLPTGVPLVLYPPNGATKRPENTDLVQVGFLYPLNYDFVWSHGESQQQIFKYLPMGIAWGLQIDIENVTMQSLRAWDTTQDLHYITTLALAWVPSGQVQSLGLLVHTPASRFYHTPDNSTNTLLSMINIALPIAADNSTDGGDTNSFGAEPSNTATMKDGGAPVGGNIGSSNPVRASSVGIACGVAAGAAAYGAAMFFVARRYRKRRQSHLRSPSMFSSPVMSHAGPDALAGAALMSGGVGDHRSPSPYHDEDIRAASRGSGRSASTGRQQISAPVMAENSLGWN